MMKEKQDGYSKRNYRLCAAVISLRLLGVIVLVGVDPLPLRPRLECPFWLGWLAAVSFPHLFFGYELCV